MGEKVRKRPTDEKPKETGTLCASPGESCSIVCKYLQHLIGTYKCSHISTPFTTQNAPTFYVLAGLIDKFRFGLSWSISNPLIRPLLHSSVLLWFVFFVLFKIVRTGYGQVLKGVIKGHALISKVNKCYELLNLIFNKTVYDWNAKMH